MVYWETGWTLVGGKFGGMWVSTYDYRLTALEKDVTVMKQDMTYKLDETNTIVTAIQGVVGVQGRDIKLLVNQNKSLDSQVKSLDSQVKNLDIRLAGVEMHMEGLTQETRAIQEQQNVQGQDIRAIKRRLDGMDQRFDSMDKKFDQVLSMLSTLTPRPQQET
jgi:uncharacterized protein YoxC